MKILADASLPNIEKVFDNLFTLSLYDNKEELDNLISKSDILFCRSTLQVNRELLANTDIKIVATASSGTDHIDKKFLAENNILLIDAKGSNACSVVDYVIATISYLQKINMLNGSNAGIIGNGEVGSRLGIALAALGFSVKSFDPLLEFTNKNYISCALEDLYVCDLLCIHANLHDDKPFPSTNLLNADFLENLKSDVTIINAARGGIVDEDSILSTCKNITYCTDVYLNEPHINPRIIDFATICTPHIAGHSVEAKEAAVLQVANKIYNYLNIEMPIKQLINTNNIISHIRDNFRDEILRLYNPIYETNYLKSATNKKQAFVDLRKEHKNRHDFGVFYN